MKLGAIAHARTGDKGDTTNISVIAYKAEDFQYIDRNLTVERVRSYFNNPSITSISRYSLPKLAALNFVLRGALSGGVTQSLALDAHGKCLSSILLDMDIGENA
jgi:hypothetical protein